MKARRHTFSFARRIAGKTALPLAAAMIGALAAGPVPAAAETDRVVAALISPGAESNRFWASSLSWHMLDPALEGLVAQDPVTGDYTGDGLAVSWEHNPDFSEWTFKLREGVEFHYGYGEFTAADVIHSYMLHTGEDAVVPGIAQLRGARVEAVDDHTVRFVYDSPRVEKLFLHGGRTVMKIYSKKQFDAEGLEGYDERIAGTGHYRFVSRSPGRVLYERVENHYSGLTPGLPGARAQVRGRGGDQARDAARRRGACRRPAARAAGRRGRRGHEHGSVRTGDDADGHLFQRTLLRVGRSGLPPGHSMVRRADP